MKINRFTYELIYALNKKTSKWLENTNSRIKTEGIDIITSNNDLNIHIQEKSAQAKYAPEVEAQIAKIKAENEPINKDQKVLAIIVDHIGIGTVRKVDMILDALKDNQENTTIAKIGTLLEKE